GEGGALLGPEACGRLPWAVPPSGGRRRPRAAARRAHRCMREDVADLRGRAVPPTPRSRAAVGARATRRRAAVPVRRRAAHTPPARDQGRARRADTRHLRDQLRARRQQARLLLRWMWRHKRWRTISGMRAPGVTISSPRLGACPPKSLVAAAPSVTRPA